MSSRLNRKKVYATTTTKSKEEKKRGLGRGGGK